MLVLGVAGDRDVIYNLSYPILNLTYKQCSLFLEIKLKGPSHSGISGPPFAEDML
jgi:hypothetical protein